MTWRRFSVLLRGLGPHSLWHTLAAAEHRQKAPDPGVTVVPPGKSDAAIDAFLGTLGMGNPN